VKVGDIVKVNEVEYFDLMKGDIGEVRSLAQKWDGRVDVFFARVNRGYSCNIEDLSWPEPKSSDLLFRCPHCNGLVQFILEA